MALGLTSYSPQSLYGSKNPQSFYTPPKVPQPTGVNTNWAAGVKPWDPQNIFSAPNPPPQSTVPNEKTYLQSNVPIPQMMTEAAPVQNIQMDPSVYANLQPQMTTDYPPAEQNMQMDPSRYNNLQPQMTTDSSMGGASNPSAFNTQYATWDNIQPYMNPFLDQIINRGNQAIQGSAAARGLLGSSGTINNIGNWTQQATEGAFNDARSAFGNDRNYMTNQYWDNRNADTNSFNTANNLGWDMYKYGNADYQGRLQDYYNANNGISNTGINASNNAGNIQGNLGQALAQLWGDRGNVGAQSAVNQGNNNSGLISGLLSLLGMMG